MNWYQKFLKIAGKWDKPYRDTIEDVTEIAGITGQNGESISDYVVEESNVSPHERISEQYGELGKQLYGDYFSCHWYFDLITKKLEWYGKNPSRFISQMAKEHIWRRYKIRVETEGSRFGF